MGSGWPERLEVDSDRLTVLRALMAAAKPAEGCALLLGDGGSRLRIRALWPCLNVWEPPAERGRRFSIDPREQLLAQKWGRRRGWQVIGTVHSHPAGPAVPSPTDRDWAFPPTLMLILGVAGDLRAWWLSEPGPPDSRRAAVRELPIRVPSVPGGTSDPDGAADSTGDLGE